MINDPLHPWAVDPNRVSLSILAWLLGKDVKKVFSSVDRGSLRDLRHKHGNLIGILLLISALYTNTKSAIKTGDVIFFFPVKSRVSQGCVIASILFNNCSDSNGRDSGDGVA